MAFDIKEELIHNSTYTETLWAAMWASQSVDWVMEGDYAPKTTVWNQWVEEARSALHGSREDFDSRGSLLTLLRATSTVPAVTS